jgi:hypothetical protein
VNRRAPHHIRREPLGIATWCRPGSPGPFELCGSALTRESRSSANLAIINGLLARVRAWCRSTRLIVIRPNCRGLQAAGVSDRGAGGVALIVPTHSLPCLGCSKIAMGRIVRHRAGRGCERVCLGRSQAGARSGIRSCDWHQGIPICKRADVAPHHQRRPCESRLISLARRAIKSLQRHFPIMFSHHM